MSVKSKDVTVSERKMSGKLQEEPVKSSGSLVRQLGAACVISSASFMQGCSLPTAALSSSSLPLVDTEEERATVNAELQATESWPRDFAVTENEQYYIAMSWLIGHLLSALIANPVAEIIGRKMSLLLDLVIFCLGFILFAIGESVIMLSMGRALMGYPLVSTVYMCEIVHPDLRGTAAAIYAITNAFGYSLTLFLGAVTPHWRWAVGIIAVLHVPVLILTVLVPESPAWLIRSEKMEEAKTALERVRGKRHDCKAEYQEMLRAAEENFAREKVSIRELLKKLRHPKFLRPFAYLVVVFFAIGWSGFSYLAFNAVEVFEGNGAGAVDKYWISFLMSLVKIPGGLFAALVLRKLPRRPIFLTAGCAVAAGHLIMALTVMGVLPAWNAMLAITLVNLGYTGGYVSVSNLLMGELLPANLRSIGVGLVATTEVISSLTQTLSTTSIVTCTFLGGKSGLFFIFASVVALCLIFAFIFMPETQGMTLEEIENCWQVDEPKPNCSIRRSVDLRPLSESLARLSQVTDRLAGPQRRKTLIASLARRQARHHNEVDTVP